MAADHDFVKSPNPSDPTCGTCGEAHDIFVPLPLDYYLGAHGDPIARFGAGTDEQPWIRLVLHEDGTVTWESVTKGQG